MYNVKNNNGESILSSYVKACCAPSRKVELKCVLGEGTILTGDYLISIELSEIMNTDTSRILMGTTPSNCVKIKMFMPGERISLEEETIKPFVGVELRGETVYIPLGTFHITEVSTSDDYKTVEFTAYDKMNFLTDTYIPSKEYAPENTYDLYTYSYDGIVASGSLCFFNTDKASYQFSMPELSKGEKLLFDTFDNKLHINEIDSSEVETTLSANGRNLTEYFTKSTYHSALLSDVLEDVLSQAEISSNEDLSSFDYRIDVYESTYTYREIIGYIAGLVGKNAMFDRDGKLCFRWYSKAKDEGGKEIQVSNEMEYLNGFETKTNETLVIGSIVSGTEENTLSIGSGYGISFTNPFMTSNRLGYIFNGVENVHEGIKDTQILPCTIKYRDIPTLECGDILCEGHYKLDDDNQKIFVGDNDIFIMAQTHIFGKGMNATIVTHGESEAESTVSKSPTDQKMEVMYKGLEQSFKEAIETFVGVKGGYFELIYDEVSRKPSGWRIMDTPSLTTESKVWTMNKSGLYYSVGGGYTVDKVAIDMNGKINANFIQTGTLNAERIAVESYGETGEKSLSNYIRFENGNILLGETGNEITLKIENDKIVFYDSNNTALAYFANDSFSIESIRKVQISNFAYLTRDNGNLTFTKVN